MIKVSNRKQLTIIKIQSGISLQPSRFPMMTPIKMFWFNFMMMTLAKMTSSGNILSTSKKWYDLETWSTKQWICKSARPEILCIHINLFQVTRSITRLESYRWSFTVLINLKRKINSRKLIHMLSVSWVKFQISLQLSLTQAIQNGNTRFSLMS